MQTNSILKTLAKFILLGISILLFSCDRITNKYPSYNSAKEDKLFEKGWIPEEVVYESMINIYQQTEIDIGNCVFHFNLNQSDIIEVKEKLQPTTKKLEVIHGISTSSKWIKDINNLERFYLIDTMQLVTQNYLDTVYFAIDIDKNKVYGWRSRWH